MHDIMFQIAKEKTSKQINNMKNKFLYKHKVMDIELEN